MRSELELNDLPGKDGELKGKFDSFCLRHKYPVVLLSGNTVALFDVSRKTDSEDAALKLASDVHSAYVCSGVTAAKAMLRNTMPIVQ